MQGMSPVHHRASVSLHVGALSSLPQPTGSAGRVSAGPATATSVLPGQESASRAWSGAGAQIAFWRAQFHAGSGAVAPWGIEEPRLSGRRCAELWSWLVYFACVFMSGGVYKYCSPVPDDAGVVLRAGAKLDLALPGGNDAYLLARRWVGTAPLLAGMANTSSAEGGLLLLK